MLFPRVVITVLCIFFLIPIFIELPAKPFQDGEQVESGLRDAGVKGK